MADPIIDQQTAERDFDSFIDAWDIDTDETEMDGDDLENFKAIKRVMIRAIRKGRLTVTDVGDPVYQLGWSGELVNITELEFHVPGGNAVLGWDKYKEKESIHKLNSYMGAMCKVAPAIFAKLDSRDLKIPQAIARLFLG